MNIMRRKSFTLIELLVVIAIIAILAGMLLPALNKARQTALSSQCTSNLRQVSLVLQNYMNEYQEYIPPNIINKPANFIGTHNYAFVLFMNYGLVKNPNIFVCPSFYPNKYKPSSIMRYAETYGTMGRGGYGKLARAHEMYVWQAQAKFPLPTSRMLFYTDSIAGTASTAAPGVARQMANWTWGTSSQTATSNAVHLRHSKKANISHLDGSVGSYGAREIADRYRIYYNSKGFGQASGYSPAVRYYFQVMAY